MRAFEPEAEATADLTALIWSKLCFTALMIAQALGQASIAECLGRPELLPLWRPLVGEMVAVARATASSRARSTGSIPPRSRSRIAGMRRERASTKSSR